MFALLAVHVTLHGYAFVFTKIAKCFVFPCMSQHIPGLWSSFSFIPATMSHNRVPFELFL